MRRAEAMHQLRQVPGDVPRGGPSPGRRERVSSPGRVWDREGRRCLTAQKQRHDHVADAAACVHSGPMRTRGARGAARKGPDTQQAAVASQGRQ